MQDSSVNKLLMLAMWSEAQALLQELGASELERISAFSSLHRADDLLIGVSGIGAANMTAMASRLLLVYPSIESVANFGSAGAYEDAALAAGSVHMINEVRQWDLHLPITGLEAQLGAVSLADHIHDQTNSVVVRCNSGNSFSSQADRDRPGFPAAELEDMELYSLACLCRAHGLPLGSIKFVSNQVGGNAHEDFSMNFKSTLDLAIPQALAMLSGWWDSNS